MTNFAFLRTVGWPAVHADCAPAESYATTDPRSACIYARRAIEQLVTHLYDVLALAVPYKNDLAARCNDSAIRSKTGVGISQKFNLIRRLGNTAVHEARPIPTQAGFDALNQRIFETRLGLITALDSAIEEDGDDPPEGSGTESERGLRVDVAWTLHRVVVGMNLANFLVRPHRMYVEQYAAWPAWSSLTPDAAGELAEHLAGLPSSNRDDDEYAKRFDMLILSRQLAQLEGDALAAERSRETVQNIASGLLNQTAIPSISQQQVLLDEPKLIPFPGVLPIDVNWERFRAKASAYLNQNVDHVALQRLRRNRPLTADDLTSLETMLLDSGAGDAGDLAHAAERTNGLGLFIRSLVGLDRQAATEAFGAFLDDTKFGVNQIRFISLIVDELTANGAMEPARLYESPFTDHAPHGPGTVFPGPDVDTIVGILRSVRENAVPKGGVA